MRLAPLAAAGALVVAACSSTPRPSPPPHPATNHRASAPACAARAPGPGGQGTDCTTDADCTAGLMGRCVPYGLAPPSCSYDECESDSDCGANGFCDCRSDVSVAANTCVRTANCRVDADCGPGGYCSPSAVPGGCGGTSITFQGYFCHTSSDECVNDADCPSGGHIGGATCDFDSAAQRWKCSTRDCVSD